MHHRLIAHLGLLSLYLQTDLFEDIKKVNPNVQLIGGAFKAAELDAKEAINQAVRMAAVI